MNVAEYIGKGMAMAYTQMAKGGWVYKGGFYGGMGPDSYSYSAHLSMMGMPMGPVSEHGEHSWRGKGDHSWHGKGGHSWCGKGDDHGWSGKGGYQGDHGHNPQDRDHGHHPQDGRSDSRPRSIVILRRRNRSHDRGGRRSSDHSGRRSRSRDRDRRRSSDHDHRSRILSIEDVSRR